MPLAKDAIETFRPKQAEIPTPVVKPSIEELVRLHVEILGKPPGYTRTTLKKINTNFYRVNVWADPIVTDSFFVMHLDGEITSDPPVSSKYPE